MLRYQKQLLLYRTCLPFEYMVPTHKAARARETRPQQMLIHIGAIICVLCVCVCLLNYLPLHVLESKASEMWVAKKHCYLGGCLHRDLKHQNKLLSKPKEFHVVVSNILKYLLF